MPIKRDIIRKKELNAEKNGHSRAKGMHHITQ